MSRLPVPGSDDDIWGNVLNDFLSVSLNADGTLKQAGTISSAVQTINGQTGPTITISPGTIGAATDSSVIHNAGNETIDGIKTFTSSPIVPTPTSGTEAANKTYVDTAASSGTPDATTVVKGKLQLAGDLAGTAAAPTVPSASGLRTATTSVDISAASAPASGQFLRASDSTHATWQTMPRMFGWYLDQTIVVGDGQGPQYRIDANVTIVGFDISCKTAPGTSAASFDVETAATPAGPWTTIFSVQPTIAAGQVIGTNGTLSTTTLNAGTYVRFDVKNVGGTAAVSVTAQLRMQTR